MATGERLLLDAVGGLILSSDNPLDFHDETYIVLAINLIYLCIDWNIK